MRRAIFTLAAALSLAACQGDNSEAGEEGADETGGTTDPIDPCGLCAPGGYAVDCGYLWGLGEFNVCGINQDNAEYLCESTWAGVVLASPSDNCASPNEPWNPALDIYADPAGGPVTIIESDLLARLEDHPQDLYLDATRLDWNASGDVFVSTEGELSVALGLEVGDVLVDVNGYSFHDMLDTLGLYSTLCAADTLTLTLERREAPLTLTFVIQ